MTLSVTDLSITTEQGRSLLSGCSWEVETGGRLGIIGESGSGKSLTSLAILGLLPDGLTASGSVMLDGRELLSLAEREKRRFRGSRIAMIFQEPLTSLDPLMKVGEQIAGPIRLHHKVSRQASRARAGELLRQVALNDRVANSYPWQLSGGQRQRVAIAMALGCEPDVLIADEPTTALDVTVQADILSLLSELITETGSTLVFITHDLPVIAQVSEDLVVMKDGRVVERTTVHRALTNPGDPYTARLIEAARHVSFAKPDGVQATEPAEENTHEL